MARIFFVVLLLANLAVFGWTTGNLGRSDDGREPERLRNQLQPERLHVTVGGEQSPRVPPNTSAAAPTVVVCRRVGPMAVADAESLQKAVIAQGGGATLTQADEPSYWVFIPPVAGKPAEKEIVLLKQAGVKDFFVVSEEGPNRNALSLGLFHKEDAAKELMQHLAKKGIKSAKLTSKPRSAAKGTLQARGTAAILDKALAGQSAEAVDCPKE